MIAAVLAGGKSRRFGDDKLLYKVDGKPIVMHTIERLLKAENIDDVVIVTCQEKKEDFEALGFRVLIDDLLVGPIGGIFVALKEVGDAFIAAGDLPLINPKFVDYIVERFYESKSLACIPMWANGYIEPLHAVYSKDFLPILKEQIKKGEYMIRKAVERVDPCYILIDDFPEEFKESFFNINTKHDLKRLLD
ncbi:molybdenum cofactor guanylyltransferase MobA [Thermococcus barophilus]|uniref:Probable molybdenum cofactor guanylyltransferase n=1 Tax=Thermococcus barophilus (strain DSM 11836 / MP) TaxID=391623 RepID=F0LMF5_THEBM|nr:molybdenum cofactor guanylyltransferase MobA [Thermococcus barophilus]ADT85178.1 molybdopterin-guanine dinucleotide biosynthesis protein A [Thermococcus barophilus MP]